MDSKIKEAEMLLIGLGDHTANLSDEQINQLADKIENINYFVVNTSSHDIRKTKINDKRLVQTAFVKDDEDDLERRQWDFYNKWMSVTLNKKLVIMEVGEGFANPNIIRWPFERITMINQKSFLFRYNDKLPQIPEEIKDRAKAICVTPDEWLDDILREEKADE